LGTYNFIDHTADIAVEITAESEKDLFVTSASALRYSLIENDIILESDKKIIELNAPSMEELLIDFLNELNYYCSVKKWLFSEITVQILSEVKGNAEVKCVLRGGDIPLAELNKINEIKAVTYHQLEIKRVAGKLKTTLVFDI